MALNVGIYTYLWTPTTNVLVSIPSGVEAMYPYGINANDQIVGRAVLTSGSERPFLWTPGLEAILLPLAAGYTSGYAHNINDSGIVVGEMSVSGGRAFRWDPTNGTQALNLPSGYSASRALAINNAGDIAGEVAVAGSGWRPWVYSNGVDTVLERPEGAISGTFTAINEQGHTAGHWYYGTGTPPFQSLTAVRGIIYDGTSTTILSNWQTDPYMEIYDLNNLGQVLGDSGVAIVFNGTEPASLFSLLDSSRTGWEHRLTVSAINDEGAIVGAGYFSGNPRGYLAIPRPSLDVARVNSSQVSLSWPTNFFRFHLEYTTNLVTWTPVTNQVEVYTNSFTVNINNFPKTTNSHLFRLSR